MEKAEDVVEKFAVIDIETNWNNEVMSIGVVVADAKSKEEIDSVYYIMDPEYKIGGMYVNELRFHEKRACIANRKQALKEIEQWLDKHSVQKLFAYNASFDKRHLPEYSRFAWYDIMRLAAYRQYNKAIPNSAECCKTGKLKQGYSVENILKMLSEDNSYSETHNAVLDAEDELRIMQLLKFDISEYDIALIGDKENLVIKPQKNDKASIPVINNNFKKKKGILSKIFGRIS